MFVRIVKARTKDYAVIVRGYRDKDGKVKQKTVQNLGPVNDKNREQMLAMGRRIIAQKKGEEFISDPKEIKEIKRVNWGCRAIIDKMWEELDLDIILAGKRKEAIKLMLADRLIAPSSKLRTFHRKDEHEGFNDIKLEQLYRGLDLLYDNKKKIKHQIFNKQASKNTIDVAFFDVTTLYFESQKDDDIRDFGYSKDCKFNEVQVVLSLVISSDGSPISYELFSGNTFEGNTLLPILDNLKEDYNISKIVIVADRGIGFKSNLDEIKKRGYDYIIGARLRSMSKDIQKEAISEEGYQPFCYNNEEEKNKYKIINQDDNNLLLLYSSKRADKDAIDRNRLVEKAKNIVLKKNVTQRGANKYIKTEKKETKLNQDKIERDSLFDGYYALSFSDDNMKAEDISSAYHHLWKIEESFRTMKSLFEVRPIFHWTSHRIQGHVLLNFILLVMEHNLLLKLRNNNSPLSHQNIRDAINKMQKSVLQLGNKNINSYAPSSQEQKDILAALNINLPKNSML